MAYQVFYLFCCLQLEPFLTVAFAEYWTGNADWSAGKVKASNSDEKSTWCWQIWYDGIWESYASCFKVTFYFV